MDFGILLLIFLGIIILIYLYKCYLKKNEYVIDDEITPEDFQFIQQHIDNINNVAVNYNPRNSIELPPKYEDIQNDLPNYPS